MDEKRDFRSGTVASDLRHVWHPYTQAETAPVPVEIVSGKGARLYAADGREFLDLISSWWVNVHGHGDPAIAAAISEQAAKLEHVIFADFTHRPAAELAARLADLAPEGLGRVFYSDNGSTAVEAALKLAVQYWRNRGAPDRNRFVAFKGGYHGDTVGAMSVGKGCGFFEPYADLMFETALLPFPETWDGDNAAEEKEKAALAAAEQYFEKDGARTAALVIEPLVQGAGGMRMCSPGYLRRLAGLARDAGVLLICDEVMTGFGRTGEMFASQTAGIVPDMMCLSKGLTGGFLPLGATLCREEIYDAFRGEDFGRAFAHGHSYSANPLGCAAALASLDLFETGDWRERSAAIHARHREFLTGLSGHDKVSRTRLTGTIAAFDIAGETGYGAAVGAALKNAFLDRGLLLRPLGNVVYVMPPYCITDAELDRGYAGLRDALDDLKD